ncbi:MAG: sulfate/molybdate ABC transporter ATP-binding protein, partial [Terriglobia bacterium]
VSGKIEINGRTLLDSTRDVDLPPQKRRTGILLQDYALFPHMTVAENVGFGLRRRPRKEARRIVQAQIALVQLQGLEERYPRELSGGQQQRVALARALATGPDALLLDEPLSALDVPLRAEMEALLVDTLASYAGAAFYVTHNLEEAYRIAEEIVVISGGKQVAFGSREEIFRHPPNFMVAKLTGCKNFSRARPLSGTSIEAVDWGCTLRVCEPLPQDLGFAGIRAHHLRFAPERGQVNTFPCTLVQTIEGPFRMTLYLQLLTPDAPSRHHHLQAEITKENWETLRGRGLPWLVQLDPGRIMLLKDES